MGEAFPIVFEGALLDDFIDGFEVCLYLCGIAQKTHAPQDGFYRIYIKDPRCKSQPIRYDFYRLIENFLITCKNRQVNSYKSYMEIKFRVEYNT